MARSAHKHLAAFADSRDEEAFTRVVEEFGGLVFSSALRRPGDFQLSEEVAQNVFAITAKKAKKLAVHPSRTAWFYATTRFEAAKAVQSHRRHQRKMQALASEVRTTLNTAGEQNWRDALPLLDGYLDRLAPAERDTQFGRFFEGRTFKELAEQSGSTEAACKMRLKRTLEKLEKIYVFGYAGGLGGGHPRVQAALGILDGTPPAELFAACRAVDFSKKRRVFASYIVSHLAASHPEECLDFLREEPDEQRSRLVVGFFRRWSEKAPSDAVDWIANNQSKEDPLLANLEARNSILSRLGFSLHRKGGAPAELAFAERLAGGQLQKVVLQGMVNHVEEVDLKQFTTDLLSMTEDPNIHGFVFERAAGRLAKDDLAAGKQWALGLQASGEAYVFEAAVGGVASRWRRSDPRAAADWWLQNSGLERREHLYSNIVDEWAQVEPNACGKWLGEQAPAEPLDLARAAFARTVLPVDPESAKAWAASIEDGAMRESLGKELH